MLTHTEELEELDAMLEYTRRTLDDRCEMSEADIRGTAIQSRWGVWYDLEQLLEHAIVHVLRHRRQIEKLLNPDSRQVAAADARSVRPRKKGSPLTEFLDRLDASRYAHDEGVSIGTAEPGGEPNWTLSIPERLFSRAHQIASAYELHLLAAIDYNDRVRLVTSQVETLSLELAFVRERIVDPLLAQHLESLAKLAESCLRSDRTKELVLEGP
jgi:hypothetical protein